MSNEKSNFISALSSTVEVLGKALLRGPMGSGVSEVGTPMALAVSTFAPPDAALFPP